MKLRISGKLAALAGVLLAATVLVGVLAIANLGAVQRLGASMFGDRVVPLYDISQARSLLGDIDSQILREQIAPDPEHKEIADRDAEAIDELIEGYRATFLVPAEKEGLAVFDRDWKLYREAYTRVLEGGEAGRAAYFDAGAPLYAAVDGTLAELSAVNRKEAAALQRDIEGQYRSSRTVVVIVLLAALAAGAGIAFLVARGIKRGVDSLLARFRSLDAQDLSALTEGLESVAAGDLTVEVTPTTTTIGSTGADEIGELSRTFDAMLAKVHGGLESYNGMRAQLGQALGDVSAGAGNVSAASQQMSSTSEEAGRAVGEIASAVSEVAEGAERQVRMVESTRSAVQAAAQAASASAELASGSAAAAQQARDLTRDGVTAAGEATAAIRALAESSSEVGGAIQTLAEKSGRIGGIVDTITGIAEQTNLLALNAAIEAARAGEQGRGFAVVAEEVRKLAEESQGAAGEISGLIDEIQSETARAVAVVDEGARLTAGGVDTVEQTRLAFERIGAAVEDVSSRMGEIAASVEQITAGSQRAGRDIDEVASVAEGSYASAEQVSASTEQTSASTQEIATAAVELAGTAERLNALVLRFKLAA